MRLRRSTVRVFTSWLLMLAGSAALAQSPTPAPSAAAAQAQQIRAKALAAPMFLPDARPSAATRASNPERWGLKAPDFSLTFDEALVAKAGLPGRWKEIEAAAKAGDAYAQTIAGIYLRLPAGGKRGKDARRYFELAARQGLARADGEALGYAWADSDSSSDDEIDALVDHVFVLGRSDSAHLRWLFSQMVMQGRFYEAVIALEYSARAGYPPALLTSARLMVAQGKDKPQEAWQKAARLAEAAAAAGLPGAAEFLKQRPAP